MPKIIHPSSRKQAAPHSSGSTVAMGFVTGLVSGAAAQGIDPSKLLARAGIARAVLKQPGARVSLLSYAALYNHVAESLDDEALGLFPQPMRSGSFEFLARVTVGSATLAEALQRMVRFLSIVLPDIQIVVSRRSELASIEILEIRKLWPKRNDPRRIFAHEWLLRLIHGLCCWLIDRSIPLDGVIFPYARPAHAADYASIYTAHYVFEGPRLAAGLQANILDAPVNRDETALAAFLVGAPGRISTLYRRDREIFRRVRDIVSQTMAEPISLDDIAGQLHISRRTLQRRLTLEGHSLRSIREAMRRTRALAKLEQSNSSIGQIASELGYSDATAFYRAFRSWTESGPRQYRQKMPKGRTNMTIKR